MAGLGTVLGNLGKWAIEKRAGVEAVAKITAANMQNYARSNRRWKDITGNARAGLNGGSGFENAQILKAWIAHSMEYGIYLELANDGKYQILSESRDKFANDFYAGVKRIMEW